MKVFSMLLLSSVFSLLTSISLSYGRSSLDRTYTAENLIINPNGYLPTRVGLIQYRAIFGDQVQNVENLTRMIRLAHSQGARIIVLPEGALLGYEHRDPDVTNPDRHKVWCTPEGAAANKGLAFSVTCVDLNDLEGRNKPEYQAYGWSGRHFENLAKELGIYLAVPTIGRVFDHVNKNTRFANMTTVYGPHGWVLRQLKSSQWSPHEFLYNSLVGTTNEGIETPYGRFVVENCNGIFQSKNRLQALMPHALFLSTAWVDQHHPGFQGFSPNGSFDFLAGEGFLGFRILAADVARRTGLFSPIPGEEFRLSDNNGNGSGNGLVLVGIHSYDTLQGPQMKVQPIALLNMDKNGHLIHNVLPGLFDPPAPSSPVKLTPPKQCDVFLAR